MPLHNPQVSGICSLLAADQEVGASRSPGVYVENLPGRNSSQAPRCIAMLGMLGAPSPLPAGHRATVGPLLVSSGLGPAADGGHTTTVLAPVPGLAAVVHVSAAPALECCLGMQWCSGGRRAGSELLCALAVCPLLRGTMQWGPRGPRPLCGPPPLQPVRWVPGSAGQHQARLYLSRPSNPNHPTWLLALITVCSSAGATGSGFHSFGFADGSRAAQHCAGRPEGPQPFTHCSRFGSACLVAAWDPVLCMALVLLSCRAGAGVQPTLDVCPG